MAALHAWLGSRRGGAYAPPRLVARRKDLLRRKFLQVEGPWYWSEQDGPRRQAASWPPHGALVLGGRRDPSALTIARQRARGIKLLAFRSFGFGGAEPVQMVSYLIELRTVGSFCLFFTLRVARQGPAVMLPAGGPAPDNTL